MSDVNGDPIAGVSVYNTSKKVGMLTDFDGKYQIVVELGETVVFQMVGYVKQYKKVDKNNIDIQLKEDRQVLESVDIVARSNINDIDSRKATGSIEQVDVKEISTRPSVNLMESLQGQVAGLTVLSSAELGKPLRIRIRGTSTLSIKSKVDPEEDTDYLDNLANQPLFVLDGQIIDSNVFANLNPNDIREIKVLKDAVANALYGIKAANGVIEVSTKRGINGKNQYSFVAQHGITLRGSPNVEMMGTEEKLAFEFASKNTQTPGYKYSEEYIRLKNRSAPDLMARITVGQRKLDSLKQINTNWFDELARISQYSTYNLSLRGGNEKNRYYLSGNFSRQGGKFENQSIHRITARLNYDFKLSDKITVFLNASLGAVQNDSPNSSTYSPADLIYKLNPYEQPNGDAYLVSFSSKTERKKYTDLINQFNKKDEGYQFNFSTNLFWQINKQLYISSVLGVNYNIENTLSVTPSTATSQSDKSRRERGKASKIKSVSYNQSTNTRINYRPFIGEHQELFLSANMDWLKTNHNSLGVTGYGLPSKLQSAAGINDHLIDKKRKTTSNSRNATGTQLGFGFSALYGYNNTFDIYASYKADASSMMPSNKRWNSFWSVGVGYHILKGIPSMNNRWVSRLHVKASYGITASLAGINAAMVHPVYKYGSPKENYLGYRSFYLKALFNKDLKPERNTTIDIGLNIQLFRRLNLSFNAYHRRTDQMIVTIPIAPSNGFSKQLRNVGVLQNQRFGNYDQW